MGVYMGGMMKMVACYVLRAMRWRYKYLSAGFIKKVAGVFDSIFGQLKMIVVAKGIWI